MYKPVLISSFLLSFHNLGEESDMGPKKKKASCYRDQMGLAKMIRVEDKAPQVKSHRNKQTHVKKNSRG